MPETTSQSEDHNRGFNNQPIVILARPQLGENIGMAARAMANFGLTKLRLVAPRDGWPNLAAWPASAGAEDILEQALCFANLRDACADCTNVFGTSARTQRRQHQTWYSCDQAVAQIINTHDQSSSCGIVFGPERSGMDNDDLTHCRAVIRIPTVEGFSSLNLSHAVAIVGYALCQHRQADQQSRHPDIPRVASAESRPGPGKEQEARHDSLDLLSDVIIHHLEESGYFRDPKRRIVQERAIRQFWHRIPARQLEVEAALGIVHSLVKRKNILHDRNVDK